jgi:RNA polymerase sigma factor (sigma-70 family)
MSVSPIYPQPKAPERAEFEALWQRTHERLRRRVTREFGAAEADEIVQETMIRCYDKWDAMDPQRSEFPWLLVIARNVAIDLHRARLRREAAESSTLEPVAAVLPDEAVCEGEVRQLVRRAFRRLSAADRQVLRMHHVDELPTAQIAELTGRTDNAVRQHLCRARRHLAEQYRLLTQSSLAAFAGLGRFLRRGRKLMAASVPGSASSALCCFSLTVGVVAGVAGIAITGPSLLRPDQGRVGRTVHPSLTLTEATDSSAMQKPAVRPAGVVPAPSPSVGGTGTVPPVTPDVPSSPVETTASGSPTGPHRYSVTLHAVPEHDVQVWQAGSSVPGGDALCQADPSHVECG